MILHIASCFLILFSNSKGVFRKTFSTPPFYFFEILLGLVSWILDSMRGQIELFQRLIQCSQLVLNGRVCELGVGYRKYVCLFSAWLFL